MLNRRRFLAGVSGGLVIAASRGLSSVPGANGREAPQPLIPDERPFRLTLPSLTSA